MLREPWCRGVWEEMEQGPHTVTAGLVLVPRALA